MGAEGDRPSPEDGTAEPADEIGSSFVEEIYALALAGHAALALELLGPATGRDDPAGRAALARARLLAAGGAKGRVESREILEGLIAGGEPPATWRAKLELARIELREERPRSAIRTLKEAVDEFRSAFGQSAGAAPLARLLSREVDLVHALSGRAARPEASGAAERAPPDLDPASLLRLVRFGRNLASQTDPDLVLRTVVTEAIDLARADRGFIVRSAGDAIEFALAQDRRGADLAPSLRDVSQTVIRQVVATRKPAFLVVPELPEDHPAAHSLHGRDLSAVACVPIEGALGVHGVLYLDRREPPEEFEDEERRLLDLFAGQAAAALDNAGAHLHKLRELEASREAIRRQRTDALRRARYHGMIGASDAMQEVYKRLDLVVPTEMPVLILGETGTGKDLVARLIHERGPRREQEYVALNCAGLADTLLESELFGHERGAFTGADRARAGLFEVANRGTLFLDEVGDMSPRMQAELLHVLQSGEMRRVGGSRTVRVDVRIIAATHRDLERMIERGEFRRDLYYRLNVLSLELPPLRERPDDVPLLLGELLARLAEGGEPPRIAEPAMRRLMAHAWPGNVRELENVARRLTVLGVPRIEARHLPPELLPDAPGAGRPGTLRQVEARAILQALETAGQNKAKAARLLGIDRKTLYNKLKQIGRT